MRRLSTKEVSTHCHSNDCWIILFNKVYDLTSYLQQHPGGSTIILNHAGTDATSTFQSIHSKTILSILPKESFIGYVITDNKSSKDKTVESLLSLYRQNDIQHQSLHDYNLNNISTIKELKYDALKIMKPRALNYCKPGADDEITLRENHQIYSKIKLKPRPNSKLLPSEINLNCNLFNDKQSSMPLFLCPTGLNKLFHPNGELSVIDACYKQNIVPMISTFSSYSHNDIFKYSQIINNTNNNDNNICIQLYICQDHEVTKGMILNALKHGCQTFIITVDAPQVGRREADIRYNLRLKSSEFKQKFDGSPFIVKDMKFKNKSDGNDNVLHKGTAGRLSSFINPKLTWNDLKWIRSFIDKNNCNKNRVELILKGIQCFEDVLIVINDVYHRNNIDGIIISNHGGRQLDFARSSLEILQEINVKIGTNICDKYGIKLYIDGGIMNGYDIFKALAFGANGVGIGRAYLYGLACDGSKGIERVIEILKMELKDIMQRMGVYDVKDINNELVVKKCTLNINRHFTITSVNYNRYFNYQPIISKL